MWSTTVKYPIEKALADFHDALRYTSVPLRRLRDFHDKTRIKNVTEQEKNKILQKFRTKNCNLSETHLAEQLDELTTRLHNGIHHYQSRNRSHREHAEALIQNFMDYLCEDYKTSVETQLSIHPNMTLEKLADLLQNEKLVTTKVYETHYKALPFSQSLLLEQSSKFDAKIAALDEDVVEKQRKHLEEPGSSKKVPGLPQLNPLVFRLSDKGISMGTDVNGAFKMLTNWMGSSSTTLFVGVDGNQSIVFGSEAEACEKQWWIPKLFGMRQPENDSTDFDSDFSDSDLDEVTVLPKTPPTVVFKIGNEKITQEASIEFLLGVLLRSLKLHAEEQLQGYFRKVLITLPIWFRSSHRLQVKCSARVAGFEECLLVNEEMGILQSLLLASETLVEESILILCENFGVVSAVECKGSNNGDNELILSVKKYDDFDRDRVEEILDSAFIPQRPQARKSQPGLPAFGPGSANARWFKSMEKIVMLSDSSWGQSLILKFKWAACKIFESASSETVMSGVCGADQEKLRRDKLDLHHEVGYKWFGNCDDRCRKTFFDDKEMPKSIARVIISSSKLSEHTETPKWKTRIATTGTFSDCQSSSNSDSETDDNDDVADDIMWNQLVKKDVTIYQNNIMDDYKATAIIGRLRVPQELFNISENIMATFERNLESLVIFKELTCRIGGIEKVYTDAKQAGWVAEDLNEDELLHTKQLISAAFRDKKESSIGNGRESIEDASEPRPSSSRKASRKRRADVAPSERRVSQRTSKASKC